MADVRTVADDSDDGNEPSQGREVRSSHARCGAEEFFDRLGACAACIRRLASAVRYRTNTRCWSGTALDRIFRWATSRC